MPLPFASINAIMEETLLVPVPKAAPPAYPTLKESWAALGWCIIITLGVVMACLIPLVKLFHLREFDEFVLALVLTIGANMLAVLWLRRRAGPQRWLGLHWRGTREQWPSYALLPLLVLAETTLLSFQRFLHLPNLVEEHFAQLTNYPVLVLVLSSILIPVTEEILFRGVLLPGLLRNYRPAVAIGQSALLFGLIHFNPAQSLNAFFMGLLLGWVYYRSRSLWLCICLHSLHNLLVFGSQMVPGLAENQSFLRYSSGERYALVLALAASTVGCCLWALHRSLQVPRVSVI
jgi:membrane protease YdiL (CAAX protease family)